MQTCSSVARTYLYLLLFEEMLLSQVQYMCTSHDDIQPNTPSGHQQASYHLCATVTDETGGAVDGGSHSGHHQFGPSTRYCPSACWTCRLSLSLGPKQIWQFKVIEIGLELDKIFIDISLMLYIQHICIDCIFVFGVTLLVFGICRGEYMLGSWCKNLHQCHTPSYHVAYRLGFGMFTTIYRQLIVAWPKWTNGNGTLPYFTMNLLVGRAQGVYHHVSPHLHRKATNDDVFKMINQFRSESTLGIPNSGAETKIHLTQELFVLRC